ncbi:Rieske 2Fe-2S domain-containing protein [Paenarthrobacter sp. NPDC056912]|uniref:Rieske 2Fe-2S domain-containing protein n=1 Tax=Paenarthrobacter sp. NPDC056912 TaxID=3345965 RepID=UPI00366BBDFD
MTDIAAYRAYWHPIATSMEVNEKPQRFTLLGEHLVAYRVDGDAVVMRDLCIHRGAALSVGNVVDGNIECAYHGWQYDRTGKCARIPALPEGRPIPSKAHAINYQVREHAGLVWVAMSDPLAPFPDWPQGCEFDAPGVRGHVVGHYPWDVGAGRAVENFLDVSHFPFIHEDVLGVREDPLVRDHEISRDDYGYSFVYLQKEPADPTAGEGEVLELNYHYRMPLTAHLQRVAPDGRWTCISLLASPTSATTSDLFITCTRNFDLDPSADQGLSDFIEMVLAQDKAVVQSVRPEQIPVDLREELHIKVPDAAGMLLRRYLGRVEGIDSVA